jgi:hypothetical protein
MLKKRKVRYLRDLQPFVASMTLAYRKGALNKCDPLSRRPEFVPHVTVPLLSDGEAPSYAKSRRKAQPLLKNAQLSLISTIALRLSLEFMDLIRGGVLPRLVLWGRV